MNFAAKRADAIFVGHDDIAEAKNYYRDLKGRAAGFGRDPVEVLILPGIRPVIGHTEAEVAQKYQEFISLVSIENALRMLGRPFNDHDFTGYPLDEAFPDVAHAGVNSQKSAVLKITKAAAAEGLTLRQAALRFATPRNVFTGTPDQVADALQIWFEARASDGFVIFESLPGQLDIFVEQVVPILQARGIFRGDYEGATLRQTLGMPFAENRYTAAKRKCVAAE